MLVVLREEVTSRPGARCLLRGFPRCPEPRQAVLEGFRGVRERNPALAGEVGDRPRHAARFP